MLITKPIVDDILGFLDAGFKFIVSIIFNALNQIVEGDFKSRVTGWFIVNILINL